MEKYIPVSQPVLTDIESRYVNDAMQKGAISGFYGEYIARFEESFAEYCGCKYGVSTTSGTTALHLAMLSLSIGPGDEILVSTLTNMATFFAVLYQGARPIPIDIESDTWNIDPCLMEARITPRTKAIVVVHLFGHPVDMDPVMDVAKKHGLRVIEDCAQAHGATYKGSKVGSIGDIGCFSFYANKIITTGEGGMITVNDQALAEKARSLKSLAFGLTNKFMHVDVGYNYRMTNVQAALGCAQMERIESIIEMKRNLGKLYTEQLKDLPELQLPVEKPYARNVYWMYHIALRGEHSRRRVEIMARLKEKGIETREGFIPYNMQEFALRTGRVRLEECPVANDYADRCFYLPSSPLLSRVEVDYVVEHLKGVLSGRVR
jgi:perosamine synthetase